MLQNLLRRLLIIPPILLAINFASFAYALIALQAQKTANPWGSAVNGPPPVWTSYLQAVSGWLQGDFGRMPGTNEPIAGVLAAAAPNSLGLLAIAFVFSSILGISLGLLAVQVQPARLSRWLVPFTTLGLALPSFFLGALFITAAVVYLTQNSAATQFLIPISGFGWDDHLILPVLALLVRPIAQIAQTTSSLLVAELDKPYITAARSIGNTWNSARRRHAFQNILAPLILALAGSLRWMTAELILVEWIFAWPGLGRLLAYVLIPPQTAGPGSLGAAAVIFLHPALLACLIPLFSAIFLLSDAAASAAAQKVDARLVQQAPVVNRG
jgi:peptide/nickel transport system permease protein